MDDLNKMFLIKYANLTEGSVYFSGGLGSIPSTISDLLTSESFKSNVGKYYNTIDIGSSNILKTVSINKAQLPTGSVVTYRARYSNDNYSWTEWSSMAEYPNKITFSESLDNKYQYVQYEVNILGNDLFESPVLTEGLDICYYMAGNMVIFFNPIDLGVDYNEYMSNIHLVDDTSVPETSVINYGVCQYNPSSPDINDYYTEVSPLINPNISSVLLHRSQEPMETDNYRDYYAINKNWPSNSPIVVFRNDVAVNPIEYSQDHLAGQIRFYEEQLSTADIKIDIIFGNSYRLIMNVKNYGSTPATINIGTVAIMYNISTREVVQI